MSQKKPSIPTDAPFELVLLPSIGAVPAETAARNRQAVADAYRAMLAGDSTAIFALMAPNVQFHESPSLPYGGTHHGPDGAQAGVAGMFRAWSHLHVEIEEFVAGGNLVIAYIFMRGVARASGELYEGPVAEMFRFSNDQIVEWRPIYWDTHRVRQVCRLD
jgi:uncharacterized protein